MSDRVKARLERGRSQNKNERSELGWIDLSFWLKSERRCDHNTTVKYLSNFKKIVHIAIKNGWLARDPFVGFKMTKREVDRPSWLKMN